MVVGFTCRGTTVGLCLGREGLGFNRAMIKLILNLRLGCFWIGNLQKEDKEKTPYLLSSEPLVARVEELSEAITLQNGPIV